MLQNELISANWNKLIPRYLVPIEPKRMGHYFTDVLIIGGGLAGMRAAQEIDPSLRTMILTKDKVEESNSAYAQGGIASVWDPEDRFDNHIQDTLVAGCDLCDPSTVEMVVREAPDRVAELIGWGTRFDQIDGALILGREGGHSHQRIIHALGDATGKEIMRAMIKHTRSLSNVEICEEAYTIDLLSHEGQCCGAVVSIQQRPAVLIWAKQTILCTGGCGQVFRESTNPRVATGDGHAIAFRAGAMMRDMEFMQFHPTVLYIAGSSRTLITEAVRGEGAYLVDSHGYRFMKDYDSRLELAPRDVVSKSIVAQMDKTQSACVYLTLAHLDPEHVQQRFPGIAKVCQSFGLDITKDPIPVRPGAHYMIGGALVDQHARTSLPGLWAAGEVTSSGLHGANRLASNSLLEGLVYGAVAGRGASQAALKDSTVGLSVLPIHYEAERSDTQEIDLADIRNSVRSLMWRQVGVHRKKERLEEALEQLIRYSSYVLAHRPSGIEGWELQNMLTVGLMMTHAALARNESRGVHLRLDYPKLDNEHWRKHLAMQNT
ncbi:MAG: L-aspartate oxidase [Planctomycetaceae bacterium]|jgi:L-aspartate oxidase|nr:L-aspartate oxidase [Planctomycetaceae bacterium]